VFGWDPSLANNKSMSESLSETAESVCIVRTPVVMRVIVVGVVVAF
jgi:hypothetical protein